MTWTTRDLLEAAVAGCMFGGVLAYGAQLAAARLFCALRQWQSRRNLKAARAAREARMAASRAAAVRDIPTGPFVEQVPAGVDPTPLLRYTICALRAQDPRRFLPDVSGTEVAS